MKILIITFIIIFSPNFVLGSQEYPSYGKVYNTKENNMITYDCNLQKNQQLECDMTQMSIRKKSKKLSEKIKEGKKQWKNEKSISKKDCKLYEQTLSFIEGKTPPPNKNIEEMTKNMKSFQKKDIIKITKSLVKFCENPVLDNFLKIITIAHDKETRTCKVSSNSFKQRFEKVDLLSNTWRAVPEATGPCGIIRLDRLELDKKSYTQWNYISKKAITNPSGQALLLKCSELDENEYVFSWRKKEIALNCDYIDFGL